MSITKHGKRFLSLFVALVFALVLTACASSVDIEARGAARDKVDEVLANIHFEKPEETVSNLEFAIREEALRPNDDFNKPVFEHKYGGTVEVISSNPDVLNVKWVKSTVRQSIVEFVRDANGNIIYAQKDSSGKLFYIDKDGNKVSTTTKEGEAVTEVTGLKFVDVYKLVGQITRPAYQTDNVTVDVTFKVSQQYTYEKEDGEEATATYSASKKVSFTILAESSPLFEGTIAELKEEALRNYTAAIKYPVNFNGTVTAVHYREGQFQVADNTGGLFVYSIVDGIQVGDYVNVQGNITQYYGILQVGSDINVTRLGTAAEPVQPIQMTLEEIAGLVPDAVVGNGFGGQYIEAEGYFRYYADKDGQMNYHLVDVKGNQVQIYYKSHTAWEEKNVLDNHLGKYVKMRFNIYTYYSSKQLWQVSFNLSDETFVEISEPVVTDEEKAGFAKDALTEQLAKKYIYTETVTLPAEDANFDAVYSYVVKEGDEDKMEIANGKLTFSEVSELTTATLVVTITVGEYTTTAEIPVEIAPIEPMTIAEVVAKPVNSDIVVAGRVTGVWSSYYNFYITDDAGDIILIYGNKTEVEIGDRVVIKGKREVYQNCPQVGTWTLLSRTPGEHELPEVDGTITVAELAALTNTTSAPFNQYLQVFAKREGNNLVDVNDSSVKITVYADTAKLPAEGTIGTFNIYFYGFSSSSVPRIVYLGLPGEYTAPELTDEEKVAADKAVLEALSGDYVAGATLTLPTLGVNGSTITWVADPVDLIDENGVLGAGLTANATLTLTATLTAGEATDEAVITINILAQVEYGTVEEARAAATDEEVKVKGVVTSIIGNNVFIQDETAGIYLYLGSNTDYADLLVIGNEVGVIGTKAVYSKLQQISGLSHVEVLGTKPVPEPVEFESIDSAAILALEGQLVTVKNVTIHTIPTIGTSGYTVKVTDGTNILEVRVDTYIADFAAVKAHFQAMIVGQPVTLVNVPVGRFNDNAQVMLSKVEQIVVAELSDAEKLAADVNALDTNLGFKTAIFDLPTEGLMGSTITWTVKSGTAVVIVDNVVTEVIRPGVDGEDAVVVLEATLTLGEEEPVTVEVTVTIAKEAEAGGDPVTVTAAYSGATTNMTDGNNASTIGLNPDLFTVTAIKNSPNQNVGLNKDGQIRIYTDRNDGNGNILQISIAAGFKITSVVFEFGASTNNPTGKLTLGENVYDLSTADLRNVTKKYSDLDITTFSLQNTQTGGSSNAQIYILSITITYVPVN
ncbi:MAG: immunoglobulin-like domain-containing protein [Bacilli bacterium]|jgi:hypothetical protein